MVGGIVLGPLSDEIGRRPVVLLGIVSGAVGSGLGAMCPEAVSLSVTRIVVGVALAGSGMVTNNMVCEGLPASHRGPAMAFLHLAFQLGKLVLIILTLPFPSRQLKDPVYAT